MKRLLIEKTIETLKEVYPYLYLVGPKRCGKKHIAFNFLKKNSTFLTLEDITKFKDAKNTPESFLDKLKIPALIAETQKSPNLLNFIKERFYEENVSELKYILTSSCNIEKHIPKEITPIEVYSLTIKEKQDKNENVIDLIISKEFLHKKYEKLKENDFLKFAIEGGFPEVQNIKSEREKYFWYSEYVWDHFFQDTLELKHLRSYEKLLDFLYILPKHSATILNKLDLRTPIGLDNKTQKLYLEALEELYHIKFLPAKELKKDRQYRRMPKFYYLDTGILCYFLNFKKVDDFYKILNLQEGEDLKNRVIETLVLSELYKHSRYSQKKVELFYAERQDKRVIDFIIKHNNDYIALSIKTSAKKIEDLEVLSKDMDFKYKIIFSFGSTVKEIKKGLFEVPLSIFI